MITKKKRFTVIKWGAVVIWAGFISLFVIALYYYWFAIADRYDIFLYNHMSSKPFDANTRSRYWMTGLVASGAVMVLYALANWYLGRITGLFHRTFTPPRWRQVWLGCAPFTGAGILIITMNVNQPTLSFSHAIPCALTAVIGLAFALLPGEMASWQPGRLICLLVAGLGLVPSLLLLRVAELPGQGFVEALVAYPVSLGTVTAGLIWSWGVVWLYSRRSDNGIKMPELLLASICLSYLLLPLAHHVLLSPPDFRYISNSANFFAFNLWFQLASWFAALISAFVITKIQRGGTYEQARTI
jgi:hypothetical protein